jgi:hypothetical protein
MELGNIAINKPQSHPEFPRQILRDGNVDATELTRFGISIADAIGLRPNASSQFSIGKNTLESSGLCNCLEAEQEANHPNKQVAQIGNSEWHPSPSSFRPSDRDI